jgi:hypothetical protein
MRWFALILFLIAFLSFLAVGIILTYQTGNLMALIIPGLLILMMRPILRFLFGSNKKEGPRK